MHPRLSRPLFLSILAAALFLGTGSAFIPLPHVHASAMSTDNGKHPVKPLSAEGGDGNGSEKDSGTPLQLPEASSDPSIPSIKLGETIRFEEYGPVILNADGSMRRIDNWDQMSEHEQEVAWRRISKRNEARRKALLEQQQGDAEGKKEEL
ncbi:hypothetical protein ACHAXT_000911 [Thalassiosira profunda]